MLLTAALLIFLSITIGGYALAAWFQHRNDAERALAARVAAMTGALSDAAPASVLKDRRLSRIAFLNGLLERMALTRPMVRLIRQAGLRKRAGEVLLYVPLLASIGFLLNQLLQGNFVSGLMFAALGGSMPLMVLQRMRRKRARQFGEQLPDALDLIEAALRAGHGLVSAFGVVAEEFPDPIAEELREVCDEVRLGLPLRDALHNLMDRIDDADLPILVVGILVAEDSGGNLAEVLDNVAHTIRERFKLLRDINVMTAQGRFSGLVLTSLPFLVGGAMLLLNYKYFSPMLDTESGHHLLLYAFLSVVSGHLLIRRIVQMPV